MPSAPRRILAASDLSEDSDKGLMAAAELARAMGASLHVAHGITPPVFPYWEGTIPDEAYASWIDSARIDLEWQVRRVLGDEPGIQLEVRVGDPAQVLADLASALDAELVVLGPHEPRMAFDDLLGTTADRLIRLCAKPCLIANRPLSIPLRQILLPVDFSPPSRHCVDVAMRLLGLGLLSGPGENASATIELLFVSAFATPQPRPFAIEPHLAQQVEAAKTALPADTSARLLPRLLSAPLPIDGIRKAAERMEADLVICGTHGFGILGRTLVGSVASAVTRTLPYSVLLVPPPSTY